MPAYSVHVEAMGYGDVEAETAALLQQLDDDGVVEELGAEVFADETRGLLMTRFTLESTDGIDAADTVREVWWGAWEAAFAEQPAPSLFAVTAMPVAVREGATA